MTLLNLIENVSIDDTELIPTITKLLKTKEKNDEI